MNIYKFSDLQEYIYMPYVPLLKTAIINIPKELTKPININIPKELSEILIKFINN